MGDLTLRHREQKTSVRDVCLHKKKGSYTAFINNETLRGYANQLSHVTRKENLKWSVEFLRLLQRTWFSSDHQFQTTLQLPVTLSFFGGGVDPEASSGFCSDLCTHGAPTFISTSTDKYKENKSLRSSL